MTDTAPQAGREGYTPGPWSIEDNMALNDALWVGAEHPEVGFVSHAEVRWGCEEAEELGDMQANARLIAAAPALLRAAKLLEAAEDFNANDCRECEGDGVPEACPKCFPLFDDARIARRAAIAQAEAVAK